MQIHLHLLRLIGLRSMKRIGSNLQMLIGLRSLKQIGSHSLKRIG